VEVKTGENGRKTKVRKKTGNAKKRIRFSSSDGKNESKDTRKKAK